MTSPSSRLAPTSRAESRYARRGGGARRAARLVAALVPAVALGVALLPTAPASAKKADEPRQIVTGWLPYWTTSASVAALQSNKDLFSEASPFWYTLVQGYKSGTASSDGKQAVVRSQVSAAGKAQLVAAARDAGVPLWPSFTDGTPARFLSGVMGSPTKRASLIDRLVGVAVTEGYEGIDLDLEKFAFSDGTSTWGTTAPRWVTFVRELAAALHAKGKKLAVTTPPQCTVAGACGTRSGYWVYSWTDIGQYVDRLRIMAYDYSWSVPGPIGPYPWAEAITRYAATVVPSGKVQIGVPTYGRDWVRRNSKGNLKIKGDCPASTPSSYDDRITFDSVKVTSSFLAARGLTRSDLQWDDTRKETFFRYTKKYSNATKSCTVYREGWYGDSRAVVARAGLVAKYQIAGIAMWTIGGEDPDQWAPLRSLARGIAPTTTAVTARIPSTVDYGSQVTVSATVRSQDLAVPDASVELQWRATGASGWTPVATGTTNPSGVATWTRTVTASGTYRTVVGRTFERAGASATAYVRVRPALTPKDRTVTASARGRAVLRAVLVPKLGQQLVVQKRVKGRWVKYSDARISKAGNPKRSVRLAGAKDAYRFKAKASTVSAAAYSAVIRVVHS